MWLAGAASLLASQKVGGESGDVNSLQEKQKKLKVRVCFLFFHLTMMCFVNYFLTIRNTKVVFHYFVLFAGSRKGPPNQT